ncbi:esterase-like activity of phytase family protein [Maridesulfovibrio ferrireducens]|uniref:esterase-like activity of phytase family protein n=1 Tax=Maridesulfovibrio ferrireducens TaxID=246191 RepID=UPI001A2F7E11|nr:esterase-like activity of phytase family protein [Maridesulfovibrio ferrireducens]MBI9110199.1 esterase-like activity of phytase family protein [Maridesulfovibrio ferrireducens]
MFKKFIVAGALLALNVGFACAADFEIEKYEIETPLKYNVSYNGKYADRFSEGFPIGIGSGMTYVGMAKDGTRIFYAIGDRGPNAASPYVLVDGKKVPSKVFPAPDFTPSYGAIGLKDGKVTLMSLIEIKDMNGQRISGRPLPVGLVGSTGEIPLSDTYKILSYDKEGLDTEGIAIDRKDGNLWICDEYGPFIAKMDVNTGRIIKKYSPGDGLPDILAKRQPNRGMEGIAVTPSNKVLGAIQSICDVDGKVASSKAPFTRLVLLDPETCETKMFAYPVDVDAYKKCKDVKIGDLHAVSDTEFLIIEQGSGKDGLRNIIYLIDIKDATDLTDKKTEKGEELEMVSGVDELKSLSIKMAEKKKIISLRDYGWKPEKAEGLALLPDMKTLAICSDNDFGFGSVTVKPVKDKDGKNVKKLTKYVIDDDKMTYDGARVETSFELKSTGEKAGFWMIKCSGSYLI